MARQKRKSTPISKIFADNISTLVAEKKETSGLNQNEIAREMGVSDGSLSGWCSDEKTITIDSLAKVSAYFGVSVDWLLGLHEGRSPDVNVQAAEEYTGLTQKTVNRIRFLTASKLSYKALFEKLFCETQGFLPFLAAVDQYADSVAVEHFLDDLYEQVWCAENNGVGQKETPEDQYDEISDKIADKYQNAIDASLDNINIPENIRRQLLYKERIDAIAKEEKDHFLRPSIPLYTSQSAIKGVALHFAAVILDNIAGIREELYAVKSTDTKRRRQNGEHSKNSRC